MAVVLNAFGFENGNNPFPALWQPNGATIPNVAKTGTYSYLANTTTACVLRIPISGALTDLAVSFWERPAADTADKLYVGVELATGEIVGIRDDPPNGTVDAYIDGVKVLDGDPLLLTWGAVWHHVQLHIILDDVTGIIEAKIDGHEVVNYPGDTIPVGATGTVAALYFSSWDDCYIDDLVIGTDGYLGDLRCVDIRPTADTAQDDWTPSAGDNYSTIDETPASDADYNETNINTDADELALEDFDGVTYTPRAVTAWIRARMEGATGDSIKVGVVSNAVESVTEHLLTASYEYYFHTDDENPDGPAAWDDAAIDALLLRYEAVIA